ncbi:MAG: type II CAAX endopeptidase family protein [Verrucomicrobia bacterium]|nr:type II CAAX endopeptidase family protein [Verrucomicrobiota bacterium]MDA1068617.1 type II CAAX endopeptidase family protein [Verrucomicrobiota bacterium]
MIEPKTKLQTRLLWRKLCSNHLLLVGLIFSSLTFFRVYGYFGPEFNGKFVMGGFLLMWFVPWVFLTRPGRRAIGLSLPHGLSWMFLAPVMGAVLALLCYVLGDVLYGSSEQHWFRSVANSFLSDERVLGMPTKQMFLMFTIPAVLFSPIGEEILFRGLIHQSVQEKHGWTSAVVVNASLFAGVHLFHHGINRTAGGWTILWVSGFLWFMFMLMFVVSVCFSWLRLRYNSLVPSIVAHSFFNLVMNVTFFYWLLVP